MNRRPILLLATALSLLTVLPLAAQQADGIRYETAGRIGRKARESLRLRFDTSPSAWTDTQWLREEVDPILRARRALRERMRDEAAKAALAADETARPRDPQIVTERLRITLGNNTDRTWSPYPDRALDARALRFPMPRDARADKRTDQQKALDRIRGRK